MEKEVPNEFETLCTEYGRVVNEGRFRKGEEIALRMLAIASQNVEASPGLKLESEAGDCEDRGDWAGAIAARQQVLELAKGEDGARFRVKPHLDLAVLYRMLGRYEESVREAEDALQAARNSDLELLVVMALEEQMQQRVNPPKRSSVRAEAGRLAALLGSEPVYALQRARILALQARCNLDLGEIEATERCLQEANRLARDFGRSGFLGMRQEFFAPAAQVEADLHLACGKPAQAARILEVLVEWQRDKASQPHLMDARSNFRLAALLERYSECLSAAGRRLEAENARWESKEILGEMGLQRIAE